MHELSICRALIEQVERIAESHAGRVVRVLIRLGPLCGVEASLLQAAYPIACAGSRIEGSTLTCEMAPMRVRCASCGRDSAADINRLVCAYCGEWRTNLVSGDELMLQTIEFELPEEASSERSAYEHV